MNMMITMIAAMAMWTANAGHSTGWANACNLEEGEFKKALDEAFTRDQIETAKKQVDAQHRMGRRMTWEESVEFDRVEFEQAIWDPMKGQVKEGLRSANIEALRAKFKEMKSAYATPGSLSQGEDDSNRCVVCLEGERDQVLIPCGHRCLCGGCKGSFENGHCPLCRKPVQAAIKVFG